MPKCCSCGKYFNLEDAIDEFNEEYGDLNYDEEYPDGNMCPQCALEETGSNIAAGEAYAFSLETGLPPDDMPDDWYSEDD